MCFQLRIFATVSSLILCSSRSRVNFRVFLIHLGLIGDEFKTARLHLMENMPGDAAFKRGRPKDTDLAIEESDITDNQITTLEEVQQ